MNLVRLSGVLSERSAIRLTPAGVPVLEFRIRHQASVTESDGVRQLDFEMDALALGDAARCLDTVALGVQIDMTGFLAPRSRRSTKIRIHIQDIALPKP
jgi:primosomal replication protein N